MPETKRRPGPAARISREAILAAARELAPDEVTLAAIGARLGVTSPALYRYFEDRTAILEALANEAREQLTPPDSDLHWEEWLREAANKERGLWKAHPDLYESAKYRAISAPAARIAIAGLKVLIEAGFTPNVALSALTITSEIAHSFGHAESRQEMPFDAEDREELHSLLGEHSLVTLDDLFRTSLDIAIDGLRAQLPSKRSRRRSPHR